jgi:hypothetical protein
MTTPGRRVARVNDAAEDASIQIYLDAGWYWVNDKLTHPTEKDLNIRIDPRTRDWYPTPKLGKVMDEVVERAGGSDELFTDDKYPTVQLARLMVEEIERAKWGGDL